MEIRRRRNINGLVILSFIILAVLNTVELVHFRDIPVFQNGDLPFHWQRILELVRSRHYFPYYAMNSFKNSGSAAMTMYPYLWLYPLAFIYKVTQSITTTTEAMLFINTFMALLISYYSSLTFSRSKDISYLFAVMYTLSFSLFLNTVDSYAIGMNDAFIVMPLVIFGFVAWLRHDDWLMLALGMTGLIYSEVLITAFMIVLFIFWALINANHLSPHHITNLLKAAVLTVLLTSLFWLPAVRLYFDNQLLRIASRRIQGVDLSQALWTAFDIRQLVGQNNVFLMTTYSVLGLVMGLGVFFYGRRFRKQMYVIAVLILLLSSKLFPWTYFRGTALSYIQFPWRLYLIPQVILTYLLAESLIYGLGHVISSHAMKNVILVLILLVAGLQLINQHHYFVTLPSDKRGAVLQMPDRQVLEDDDIEGHDYYPQRTVPVFRQIERHAAILPNGKPIMKVHPKGHGKYIINSHHDYRKLALPFIKYNGTPYRITYDGRRIRTIHNRYDLMMFSHVQPGRHRIQIMVMPSRTIRVAEVMTILGIIIYILTIMSRSSESRTINREN